MKHDVEFLRRAAIELMPLAMQLSAEVKQGILGAPAQAEVNGKRAASLAWQLAHELAEAGERYAAEQELKVFEDPKRAGV